MLLVDEQRGSAEPYTAARTSYTTACNPYATACTSYTTGEPNRERRKAAS